MKILLDNLKKFIIRQKCSIIKRRNSPKKASNIAKLEKIHDSYLEKRCFIIGGSPSLQLLDLTKLEGEYTFTTGKGFKLREMGLKHSTFHVMSDTFGYLEEEENIPLDFSQIFFSSQNVPFNKKVKCSIRFQFKHDDENQFKFEGNLLNPLYAAQTVITFAMSIAFWMGFKEIILIGVDCDFKNIAGHAYHQAIGEIERQKIHSVSNGNKMLDGIKISAMEMEKKGIKILNASPSGIVDFIPRVNYENLF